MKLTAKKQKLANGLTLVTAPMNTDSVTVLLMVRVGSRDESKRLNGMSHFLEHMVFKGTKKWPRPMDMNRVIDSIGGNFNAFTSQEYTGFWVKIAKKHLPLGLEYVYQSVFHPLLPAAEMEKERGVILEEIKMYEDNPMSKVGRAFVSQVYGVTQLGQEIIGPAKNIKSFKITDFQAYMKTWYHSSNMVLGVAGGLPVGKAGLKSDVTSLVNQVYSNIGHEGPVAYTDKPKEIVLKQNKPKSKLIYKDIQQAHFCIGLETFKQTDKRRFALALLRIILGGNSSSRLWEEIREKRGLVYYVKTMTDSFLDTGYLVTQAGCDPKRVEEAIKVTLNHYQNILKGVTTKELALAKEYVKGKWALGMEDSQDVAEEFVLQLLMENNLRSIEKIKSQIEAVTLADVKKVARDIFVKEKMNLTVLGPFKKDKFSLLLS
jgi:predicted Zn-dependent peptidase